MDEGAAEAFLQTADSESCRGDAEDDFTRSFLCCALKSFQKPAEESLPMALPPWTPEESEPIRLLSEAAFSDDPLSDEELEKYERMAQHPGTEAWVWLQVLSMNALYCGGGHKPSRVGPDSLDEETFMHKNTPVRNGAFGVHKAWLLREDRTWLRTLRSLAALFDRPYVEMNQASGKVLTAAATDEFFLLSMALPLHCGCPRRPSSMGVRMQLMLQKVEVERARQRDWQGLKHVKQALDLLGVVPMGVVAILQWMQEASVVA
eukprot:s225_g25.t1